MRQIRVLVVGEACPDDDTADERPDVTIVGRTSEETEVPRLMATCRPNMVVLDPAGWLDPQMVLALDDLVPDVAPMIVLSSSEPIDMVRLCHLLSRAAPGPPRQAMDGPAGDPEECPDGAFDLSPRELDVLGCAASAMTNRQIAARLFITTGTVKAHMHSAFRKLGAVSRLDAVVKVARLGLIPAPEAPDARSAPGADGPVQ